MTDLTTILGQEVIIGGARVRDSDIVERLVEGRMFVGDSVNKGTAETQCRATEEADTEFLGIVLGHSVRQTDTETPGTAGAVRTGATPVLVVGKSVKILKPSKGRFLVRCMISGYDSGSTVPGGSPVYPNSVGATMTQNDATQLGDFYADPAQEGDSNPVGRLSKPAILGDTTSNHVNTSSEMWY